MRNAKAPGMKRVVFIGGAGDVARVAEDKLLSMPDDYRLLLTDIDLEMAEEARDLLRSPLVEAAFVDVFDPAVLREVIGGCDLAVNCAGPYYRTGKPVALACMDEGVDYIDLCDDEESATELLEMDGKAHEAGITALICCGIAPGVVNVIARALARDMDRVIGIDLAWVTGSEPAGKGGTGSGEAVLAHMLHCCMGTCVTIRDGERLEIPSFRRGRIIEFPEPLGHYEVFELGHAETATMPRFFPGIRSVRTMGALHPPYLNGIFRGLARQVEKGVVSMDEAVGFIAALETGGKARGLGPYLGILGGVLSQVFRRELSLGGFLGFIREIAGAAPTESAGGIMVTVEGTRGGIAVSERFVDSGGREGPEAEIDMNEATGAPLAVFASMLLDGLITRKGVLAPEGCIDPVEFFSRMERVMPGPWREFGQEP